MSDSGLLDSVKKRIGLSLDITDYDDDVQLMIDDALGDLTASGVSDVLADSPGVLTAVALYCMAHLGDDRSNTDKYMSMYRNKVSRLALEVDEHVC